MNNLLNSIKKSYPKLYAQITYHDVKCIGPENHNGYIEYKRTLALIDNLKLEKYATQMQWRISENVKKNYAVYYVGIDDDGSTVGLDENSALKSIETFHRIVDKIGASIVNLQIIPISTDLPNKFVLRLKVKIKKLINNYLHDI